MPKVTLHLSGYLAKLAGTRKVVTYAESIRDALERLSQFPKLDPNLTSKRYVIKVRECESMDALDAPLTVTDLHLIPQPYKADRFSGGGGERGAWTRIIVGAILIVVGIVLTLNGSPELGAYAIKVGILMVAGGIYSLLYPPEDPKEHERSTTFSHSNTTESGTPIPLILGRHRFGGHILSFNIDSVNRGSSSKTPNTPQGWSKVV